MLRWISIVLALSDPSLCQPQPQPQPAAVSGWLDKQLPSYLEPYRGLHQEPELAFQERDTSALAAPAHERAGHAVTRGVGGFGVVAVLKNDAALALRTGVQTLVALVTGLLPPSAAVK